jgi:DNA-binding FrmR family transcriptional regulator
MTSSAIQLLDVPQGAGACAVDDPACCATEHGPHGYASDKEAYLKRMRRIEGQVRGIARMIDDDVYCIDILTQVSAVKSALQAVSLALIEDHLSHCVVDAARQSPQAGAEKVREAADAIRRLVRS